MKKTTILLVAILFCITAFAQKKVNTSMSVGNPSDAKPVDIEEGIYKNAIKHGDYEVAKNAIYALMEKHPTNNSYLDTLAHLYYRMGAYTQCVMTGTEYLQKDTANTGVMELVAVSQGALDHYKEALGLWEKLWVSSGNLDYAYQVAVNQYLLKRFGECGQTIDIILKDPNAEKQKVTITTDAGHSQRIPMKAASYNLLGVIQRELNRPEQARESFQSALKISPDFDLAKGNLDDMNKKEKEAVTPKDEKKK